MRPIMNGKHVKMQFMQDISLLSPIFHGECGKIISSIYSCRNSCGFLNCLMWILYTFCCSMSTGYTRGWNVQTKNATQTNFGTYSQNQTYRTATGDVRSSVLCDDVFELELEHQLIFVARSLHAVARQKKRYLGTGWSIKRAGFTLES